MRNNLIYKPEPEGRSPEGKVFINQIYHEAGSDITDLFEANTWFTQAHTQCLCNVNHRAGHISNIKLKGIYIALYLIYMPSDSFDVCLYQDINIIIYNNNYIYYRIYIIIIYMNASLYLPAFLHSTIVHLAADHHQVRRQLDLKKNRIFLHL